MEADLGVFAVVGHTEFDKIFEESFDAPLEYYLEEFHDVFLPSSLEDKLKILPNQ